MATLVRSTSFNFNGDENLYAKKYIDKLLPFMPDYGDFNIYKIIDISDLSDIDKQKAKELYYEIRNMLTNQLYYTQDHIEFDNVILLTDKGRLAKKSYAKPENSIIHQPLTINATNFIVGDNHGNQTNFDNYSAPSQTSVPKKSRLTSIILWVSNHITQIIVSAIAAIIAGYVLFKLHWLG